MMKETKKWHHLIIIYYPYFSGVLCKVSQAAASLLHKAPSEVNADELNDLFRSVKKVYPVLAFQWCQLLSVLNYQSLKFWKAILTHRGDSINSCLVTSGGVIVYCDLLVIYLKTYKTWLWVIGSFRMRTFPKSPHYGLFMLTVTA